MQDVTEKDIKARGLELLLAQPVIAVSFFFMWLCGIIITYLLVGTNSKFSKHRKATDSFWFKFAMGFLPCALVMLVYHGIVFKKFVSSIDDLACTAIPSALILASITFICFIVRSFK